MKLVFGVSLSPKVHQVVFALICLLLVGAGVAGRMALDRLERSYDAMLDDSKRPSQVFLWHFGASTASTNALPITYNEPLPELDDEALEM